MHRPIVLLAMLLLTAANASADDAGPTIRASGEATVTSRPDRAEIDVGVVTRATSARAAATQNATQVRDVLASLRRALGSRATIETAGYSIQPVYEHPRDGGQATLTGYSASNLVRVTLDDLSRVGPVIDAATRSGANQIQNIRFTLADDAAAQARALRAAAIEARANATSMARALGLEVVRVTSVVESGPAVRPMYETAMARGATPIVPGTIETTVQVTIEVEVAADRRASTPAPRTR